MVLRTVTNLGSVVVHIFTGEILGFITVTRIMLLGVVLSSGNESADMIIGHNFVQFDAPMLNKLLQPRLIDPRKIADTLQSAG